MKSWNDVVFPVLALVPMGWNQALNVCQWTHEHIAERVSLRRIDSPILLLVGLSQQEGVARDAAERVSDALVEVGLPVHPVTFSPRGETFGWDFDPERPIVGVSPRALAPPYCHGSCRISGLGERGRN